MLCIASLCSPVEMVLVVYGFPSMVHALQVGLAPLITDRSALGSSIGGG